MEASGEGTRLVGLALNECTLRRCFVVNAYYMDGFVCTIMLRVNFSQLGGERKDKYRYKLEAGGLELSMCVQKDLRSLLNRTGPRLIRWRELH